MGSKCYLLHVSPQDGKAESIASSHKKLGKNLLVIGFDGTTVMTGHSGGVIRIVEERLGRPLQWSMCLLDCNELPLRLVFRLLDGVTTGPDSFSGKIRKMIGEVVSIWMLKIFANSQRIFFVLSDEALCDVSNDQHYTYQICWSIIHGTLDPDLQLLKVGPLCHSRWLTLGC